MTYTRTLQGPLLVLPRLNLKCGLVLFDVSFGLQALQDCFDKICSKIKNQDCIPAHSKEILYEKESYTFCGSIHLVMMMNLIHDSKYGLTRLKKSYRFYYPFPNLRLWGNYKSSAYI